jgi:SAM-dependent methyltransferase
VSGARQYFATRFAPDPRRKQVWARLVPYLARYVPPNARVLELGAGYCYFSNGIRAQRRVAVDVADAVTRHAAAGVEAIQADALAFLRDAPANSFDFVFASNFLEHFEWPVLD